MKIEDRDEGRRERREMEIEAGEIGRSRVSLGGFHGSRNEEREGDWERENES